ncbi:hypothetical protein EAI_03211 [Harpegnathos saltator]|uniref:Uncharacterized protein n=1 Tax=Harpegnathos saltator TaxID=610380 RepID=E2B2B7_HARSA|nr:hypothetical protein EAI_03211 [Harpegnathos saltator]
MTVAAAAVALWHRAHIYKALACVVLALIGVQYLLSGGVLDRRSIETIFTINATRYADHSYRSHPRGLIIYGPATVPSLSGAGNASSTTTISSIPVKGISNSSRGEPAPTRNLANGGTARELSVASNNASNNATTMPRCPLIPPNLGECPWRVAKNNATMYLLFSFAFFPSHLCGTCCFSWTGGGQ